MFGGYMNKYYCPVCDQVNELKEIIYTPIIIHGNYKYECKCGLLISHKNLHQIETLLEFFRV